MQALVRHIWELPKRVSQARAALGKEDPAEGLAQTLSPCWGCFDCPLGSRDKTWKAGRP